MGHVDDHVLLAADHSTSAQFHQDIPGVQVELFRRTIGVQQEAGIHARIAQHQRCALDHLGPLHDGFHHILRQIHIAIKIQTGLITKALEHAGHHLCLGVARPGAQAISALVPLSEMFGYATDLRSRTQGRGQYSMEPHSYVEIPKSIAEKIIAERGRKDD